MEYESQPLSTLGDGLRVHLIDCWLDGSIWAIVRDREDKQSVVCLDGRESSSTRYRLFEGGKHPGRSNARLVELGSPEEDRVVGLLSRWYDSEEFYKHGCREEFRGMIQDALLGLRLADPYDKPAGA